LYTIESGGEEFRDNVVAKVVHIASIARSAKKKLEKAAREALEVVHTEMKQKGKQLN